MYDAVKNRRLIFIEDIGYFMITNVSDGFDGTSQYKDVKAESIDVEIAQKMIPFIADDTYRFSTDSASDTTGLFDTIAATLPLWTIGTVDSSVASKYRTLEDVDTSTNCLGFFLQNMQDAYECIFVFDIIHRIINVYSQDNYVVDTSIHITRDDSINSIEVREDADDLYTAISVRGEDESVTIGSVNPLGTNTIYDFHYYLSWMSSGLRAKVSAWQNAIDAAKTAYYNNNLAYYTNLATAANYELELQKLQTQITMYTRCRENIVASGSTWIVPSYNTVIVENGGTAITISAEISATLSTIDSLVSDCKSDYAQTQNLLTNLNSVIATYRAAIQATVNALSMSGYFTASELEELNHYIFEGSYTDEYVTITDDMLYTEQFEQMKLLYDRASARLERVSEPTQEFDIDTENFIFAKDFEHWSDELETGCLINVELDDGDIALLFLSTITINYDDMSLKLTFGNRFNKFDAKSLFDNMLGDISKSANTLSYLKEILYPIKSGEFNAMQEALQASRDLTMAAALASTNEEVVIDGSGYTGKQLLPNGEYDPRQIKITGKSIVFTDDAWETCKAAIGEIILGNSQFAYGINAEALIGNMIIGNNLHIIDNNGNDVLAVTSNSIKASIASAQQKYDMSGLPSSVSITLFGYGDPDDAGFDASGLADNSVYYLDQSTGMVWTVSFEQWICYQETALPLITTGLQSQITQTASDIRSEVSTATGDLQSQITQNAENITLKVSNTDYNGNTIIGKINLDSTTATISASRINLVGAVTISSLSSAAQSSLLSNTTVKTQYYLSTSSSDTTGGSWLDAMPAWSSGKYIWTRTATTKTNAAGTSTTTYSTAVYDSNLSTALSTAASADAKLVSWASSANTTYIDGSKIYTGSIMVEKIKLYGKMNVYQSSSSSTLGGYIGYMSGSTDDTNTTDGIAIMSTNNMNYAIVTTAGVRLEHVYTNSSNVTTYNALVLSANHLDWEGGYANFKGNVYLNRDSSTTSYTGGTYLHNLYARSEATSNDGVRILGGTSSNEFGEVITYNTSTSSTKRLVLIGRQNNNGFVGIYDGGTLLASINGDSSRGGFLTLYSADGTASATLTYAKLASWL